MDANDLLRALLGGSNPAADDDPNALDLLDLLRRGFSGPGQSPESGASSEWTTAPESPTPAGMATIIELLAGKAQTDRPGADAGLAASGVGGVGDLLERIQSGGWLDKEGIAEELVARSGIDLAQVKKILDVLRLLTGQRSRRKTTRKSSAAGAKRTTSSRKSTSSSSSTKKSTSRAKSSDSTTVERASRSPRKPRSTGSRTSEDAEVKPKRSSTSRKSTGATKKTTTTPKPKSSDSTASKPRRSPKKTDEKPKSGSLDNLIDDWSAS